MNLQLDSDNINTLYKTNTIVSWEELVVINFKFCMSQIFLLSYNNKQSGSACKIWDFKHSIESWKFYQFILINFVIRLKQENKFGYMILLQ